MTDEQIVRTLATFLGYSGEIRQNRAGTHWHLVAEVSDEGHESWTTLEFLTSYDALAPVWQKVYDEFGGETETTAMNSLFFPDTTSLETCRAWFLRTPKQHAEALARAIEEGGTR